MDTLPKDILFKMALDSELPALLNWCQTSNKFNKEICGNDYIWRAKLLKDYPEYQDLDLSFLSPPSLKEKYVFMYQLDYIKKLLNTEKSLKDIFLKKILDLSKKDLKTVLSFNLPNLTELYLQNNQLTKIPSFNHLPNLKYLYLQNNQLTKVPSFNLLLNLRALHLNDNKLIEVPNFNLPNLEHIDLKNNNLTEVPAFNFLNLDRLDLTNNKLKKVPEFNFPNFRHLYLSNNQLKEVPNFNLPKLIDLNLSYNQLTDIPDFNFPKIWKINLSNNQLTEETKSELKKKYGNKIVL